MNTDIVCYRGVSIEVLTNRLPKSGKWKAQVRVELPPSFLGSNLTNLMPYFLSYEEAYDAALQIGKSAVDSRLGSQKELSAHLAKEAKTRARGEALAVVVLTFVPLLIVIAFYSIKFLRSLLVYPTVLMILLAGGWAGKRAYKIFDKNESRDINVGALIAAAIIAITTIMFLRLLFTHEMARALDAAFQPSDD